MTDDADYLTCLCWIEPLAATIDATPKPSPVEERDEVVGGGDGGAQPAPSETHRHGAEQTLSGPPLTRHAGTPVTRGG